MKRLIIINGKLILPTGLEEGKVLVCQDGKIQDMIPAIDYTKQKEDTIVDAEGCFVSPGFIDMHLHGGGGYDFMDATVEAYLGVAEAHMKHGTTAMVPTTLTSSDDELLETFEVYKQARKINTKGARFLGLHLEGPYFSPKQCGAQDPKFLQTPKPEVYNRILNASDDIIRWSVAPELDGALEMGKVLKEHHILASIAHTDATYEEVLKAYDAGYTHVTHLYSAMSTVTRRNAYRYAGVVEAAYLIDGLTVEIIADGIHLPKPLLQFVYRFKGPEKTALCTDAMRGAGMPDGEYLLGSLKNGQRVIVEDGVAKLPDRSAFAGSVATTDRLVRTMVQIAGVPLMDAIKMMTQTPARILGIDAYKGTLEKGKDADIVIFDNQININHTIIEGHVNYSRKN
jgi:N-acetylglucosamine-6-phosphate deacetylase